MSGFAGRGRAPLMSNPRVVIWRTMIYTLFYNVHATRGSWGPFRAIDEALEWPLAKFGGPTHHNNLPKMEGHWHVHCPSTRIASSEACMGTPD